MFRASSISLLAAPSSVTYVMKAASIRSPISPAERYTSLSVPLGVLTTDLGFPALVGKIPDNKAKLEEMAGDNNPLKYEWLEEGGMLVARHRSTDLARGATSVLGMGSLDARARRLQMVLAEVETLAAKTIATREKTMTTIEKTMTTVTEALTDIREERKMVREMTAEARELRESADILYQQVASRDALTQFPGSCYLLLSKIGQVLLSKPGRRRRESAYRYAQRCLDAALNAGEVDLLKIHDEETRRTCTTLVQLFSGRPSMEQLRDAHSYRLATPTKFAAYLKNPVYYGIKETCPNIEEYMDNDTAEVLVRQWRRVYEKYMGGGYEDERA